VADSQKQEYRVLRGLNWGRDERAEPDDIRSDIPPESIPWLLRDGLIELVGGTSPKDMNRSDLDVYAATVGVKEPEKLPNKNAVLAAIEEVA